MLEALYYGSEQVEEKYLHNFSKEEAKTFRLHIQKEQEFSARVKQYLDQMMADGCVAEFSEYGARLSTALDIKYALNRIAANDPREGAFSLSKVDAEVIENPDRLALDIAKAFRHNTNCKRITLSGIGLTDNGMLPILRAVGDKELYHLDISDNNITAQSLDVVATSLASLDNKWQSVNLGKIKVTAGQEKSLSRHPNLFFKVAPVEAPTVAPTPQKPKRFLGRLFAR